MGGGGRAQSFFKKRVKFWWDCYMKQIPRRRITVTSSLNEKTWD
jgi:hypothetical protein